MGYGLVQACDLQIPSKYGLRASPGLRSANPVQSCAPDMVRDFHWLGSLRSQMTVSSPTYTEFSWACSVHDSVRFDELVPHFQRFEEFRSRSTFGRSLPAFPAILGFSSAGVQGVVSRTCVGFSRDLVRDRVRIRASCNPLAPEKNR
jgi:hypothetical protein